MDEVFKSIAIDIRNGLVTGPLRDADADAIFEEVYNGLQRNVLELIDIASQEKAQKLYYTYLKSKFKNMYIYLKKDANSVFFSFKIR